MQLMKIKKLLAVTLAGILAVSTAGCSREPALTRYDAQFLQLFDTITSMVGYAKDKETFTAYAQELHDELEVYHQLYRGDQTSEQLYAKISDTLTVLTQGGELHA